jgi:hypothetical protein
MQDELDNLKSQLAVTTDTKAAAATNKVSNTKLSNKSFQKKNEAWNSSSNRRGPNQEDWDQGFPLVYSPHDVDSPPPQGIPQLSWCSCQRTSSQHRHSSNCHGHVCQSHSRAH